MADAVSIVNKRGGGGSAPPSKAKQGFDARFRGAQNIGGSKMAQAMGSDFIDADPPLLSFMQMLKVKRDLLTKPDGSPLSDSVKSQLSQLNESITILASDQSPTEALYLQLRKKISRLSYYSPQAAQLREAFGSDVSLDEMCRRLSAQKIASAHQRHVLESVFGETDQDLTKASEILRNNAAGSSGNRFGPLAAAGDGSGDSRIPLSQTDAITTFMA
jgi:hypothetical protein